MKYLHRINKTLIIINIILGFTIYFGLLFLIPLGLTQLCMTIIILSNEKKLSKEILRFLTIYCFITITILIGIVLIYTNIIGNNEGLFFIGMLASITMAFLHLQITYLIDKMIKSDIENNENKKELLLSNNES